MIKHPFLSVFFFTPDYPNSFSTPIRAKWMEGTPAGAHQEGDRLPNSLFAVAVVFVPTGSFVPPVTI